MILRGIIKVSYQLQHFSLIIHQYEDDYYTLSATVKSLHLFLWSSLHQVVCPSPLVCVYKIWYICQPNTNQIFASTL